MPQQWTPEDWEIWRSGEWASWWPSQEEYYGQANQQQPQTLQPSPPGYPPPKKARVETPEDTKDETKGEAKEETLEEVEIEETPLEPGMPTPGLTEVKTEPAEEPNEADINQKLAEAIAQHQCGSFAV